MLTRRRFLRYGAATLALGGCASPPGTRRGGPLGKPRIALVGVRAQGRRHLDRLLGRSDVDIAAVCDPDVTLAVQAARLCERYGRRVSVYKDARELLESPAIDALVVATPDHWHALLASWALRSGKNVLLETPVTHAIEEGEWLAAAAAAAAGFLMPALGVGLHPAMRDAIQFAREGGIGRIRGVRVVCCRRRATIGEARGSGFVPGHVDYDLWTGPAPRRPLGRRRLHGDWRFQWDFGNGDLGDGAHDLLDLGARLLAGLRFPRRISALGGRFGYRDDGETPNTLLCRMDFDGVPLVLEQRNLPRRLGETEMDRIEGVRWGVLAQGEGRVLALDPQRPLAVAFDDQGNMLRRFRGRRHVVDAFVDACIAGTRPPLDVEAGRRAADLLHLVNIAHRIGSPVRRLEVLRSVADDPLMLGCFDSLDLHLARNGLDLDRLGARFLSDARVDPVTGRFPLEETADQLRRRNYRAPFVPDAAGVHENGPPHP